MDIKDLLTEVDRLQAEIEELRPLDSDQEQRVMQKLRLEWNYHSNAIEGNTLTYGETRAFLMHGITAAGKPFKDYLDIRGHDEAIDHLVEFVKGDQILTEAEIRELHKILLIEPYTVDAVTADGKSTTRTIQIGQYKTHPNHVVTSTGQLHRYARPEETPALMQELMQWYRDEWTRVESGDTHPVTLAALFHYRFVAIHPFDDGNGRMARLLMNLALMKAGYLPTVLKAESKGRYFLALERADAGEYEDLVRYVAENLIASQKLYIRAARGEEIEELQDFDKRVALLKRRLETEHPSLGPARTLEAQARLSGILITPLLTIVSERLIQIDPIFIHLNFSIHCEGRGESMVFSTDRFQSIDRAREFVSTHDMTRLNFINQWSASAHNPEANLVLIVRCLFGDHRFSIVYITLHSGQTTLLESEYSDMWDNDDIQRLAATILNKFYESLEAVTA